MSQKNPKRDDAHQNRLEKIRLPFRKLPIVGYRRHGRRTPLLKGVSRASLWGNALCVFSSDQRRSFFCHTLLFCERMIVTLVAALVSEYNSDGLAALVDPSTSPTARASNRQRTAIQHGNRLWPTQPPPEGGGSQRFRLIRWNFEMQG